MTAAAGVDIDPDSGEITGIVADGADMDSPYDVTVTVTDPSGSSASTDFDWTVRPAAAGVVEVEIDILMPCFFVNGFGTMPVTIYGNDQIDAGLVELATVHLEGMPVQRILRWYASVVADFDGDGAKDVLISIDEVRGAFPGGATSATLTGRLRDVTSFTGSDEVCVLPWPTQFQ